MLSGQTYDEKELLARIAEGDERAFSLLLRQYGETVYSQALAYTKSVETAEELTQDIFLKIWQGRKKLTEIDRFEDWLFIVARNQVFDALKKAVRNPVVPLPDLAGIDTDTPATQTESRESYKLLLEGINLLPEKRREVFRMSRLEGLTHEEIANRLGIHKITVAQYIVMSLNFLKSYLYEHTKDAILVIILLRGVIVNS